MAPLLLLTVLFICGLVNSYFFPPSNFLPWLRSLYFKPISTKKAASTAPPKSERKNSKQKAPAEELQTIFSTFDSDGDGFITAKELEESLKRLKLSATLEEVKGMMERVDANGDGLIDVEEFRELYESLESSGSKGLEGVDGELDLKEAFQVFDGNRDGVITVEELGLVLASMGLKQGAEEEDCRDMIRKVDLDGDGKVNFEEFKKMMMVN